MVRTGALPVSEQILLDLFAPPIISVTWLVLSKGWSGFLGTTTSVAVKGWTKSGFWFLLVGCYLLMFGITAYAHLFRN